MFFYPTVLNHRTGRFATIWLAATKGRKISRRDLLKVNVYSTCCDIMDFVLVRVPPPMAGLPRPRFSLYLSSQLQYGVVLVFHRQCEFLLEETQGAIDRLLRLNRTNNIDLLDEETRLSHMIPDAATLFNETRGARDPFFGVMEYGLPSPSRLIQRREEPSPELLLPTREPAPPSDGITASQESITLPERELVTMPEPEFEGTDLLESNMIELLLEQPDHFLEREDERQMETDRDIEQIEAEGDKEPRIPVEREQERAVLERETARELTISDLTQITGVSSQEAALLPEEDLWLPMEMPVLKERERTPISVAVPIPFPLPIEEEEAGVDPRREWAAADRSPRLEPAALSPEPAEEKRKRRRQLLFVDEHTQISQERMRTQVDNVVTMTRPLSSLIKPPEMIFMKSAKELLAKPCMDLPLEILALWKQAAVVRPISSSVRPWELSEADETPERVEEEPEPQEMDIPRGIVEPELFQELTPASLEVLETTDKDFSPLGTPEMTRSPVPEPLFRLEDIPEERLPEVEDISMAVEQQIRPQDVSEDLVPFHSLLPHLPSRRTVANMFWRLLEETVAGQIKVQQDVPYGDIIISQS